MGYLTHFNLFELLDANVGHRKFPNLLIAGVTMIFSHERYLIKVFNVYHEFHSSLTAKSTDPGSDKEHVGID